jgi:hypothetical protein
MENKFIDLIEEAKTEIEEVKKLVSKSGTPELASIHQKVVDVLEKKLVTLEDLFFEYTMESLKVGIIEVDELQRRLNGGNGS